MCDQLLSEMILQSYIGSVEIFCCTFIHFGLDFSGLYRKGVGIKKTSWWKNQQFILVIYVDNIAACVGKGVMKMQMNEVAG